MKNLTGLKRAVTFAMGVFCVAAVAGAAPSPVYAEEITTEENTVTADNTAMHYDVRDGGTWGNH